MVRKVSNEELGRVSIDEYKESPKVPVVVLLDNIRSMHNVGSVFRTSDAFCVECIVLTGITARPPHRDIHKTALGATESVEWKYQEDSLDAVLQLKSEGYKIIAVEQAEPSESLDTFSFSPEEKYVLVFGNEVFGVKSEIVEAADVCLEIPQFGTKHSLNVSVSVGLVLWEVFRKLGGIK